VTLAHSLLFQIIGTRDSLKCLDTMLVFLIDFLSVWPILLFLFPTLLMSSMIARYLYHSIQVCQFKGANLERYGTHSRLFILTHRCPVHVFLREIWRKKLSARPFL
jgi:hypothetical protein